LSGLRPAAGEYSTANPTAVAMTIDEQRTKYLTDLMALEKHLLETINRQRSDEDVRLNVYVNELIIRIERCARDHYDSLKELSAAYLVEENAIKKALGTVLGTAAGLIEGIRDHKLPRILRDNYVMLSVAAMQYTTVHAFASAIRDERLASQSLLHLRDITPLLVALSKLLPEVVVADVAVDHGAVIDLAAADLARTRTQEAWSHEVTETQ
jgi:hypothetical protein